MKTNTLKCSVIALVPAAMLALVSCSSNSSTPAGLTSSSAVYQPGVPGGVMVDSYKMNATVTSIDADIYVVPRRRAPEFTTDFTDRAMLLKAVPATRGTGNPIKWRFAT
jgi:hypothetical protein